MLHGKKILTVALFFLAFSSTGFSGGINGGFKLFGTKQIILPHIKSQYSTNPYNRIQNKYSKHRRTRSTRYIKNHKNRIYPFGLIYDPRYVYYGGKKLEKNPNVKVNIIIVGDEVKIDKPIDSKVMQDKPISPPHMVRLSDIVKRKTTKHLRSTKNPQSVILIHGTQVSETVIPSNQ